MQWKAHRVGSGGLPPDNPEHSATARCAFPTIGKTLVTTSCLILSDKDRNHWVAIRNGRNQAILIPREFEFSGDRVIMRKIGKRLILEPAPQRKLAEVLRQLSPLPATETLPDVDNLMPLDTDPLD